MAASGDDATEKGASADADESPDGPMFLMTSKKMADAMTPSEPNSFAEYLLPYAALVGGAFLLASAAFATLVLKG